MKAEELQLGDWVQVRTNEGNTYQGRIDVIYYGEIAVNVTANIKGYVVMATQAVKPEQVEPILLTPDILTKNGFAHKHNHNEGWLSLEEYPNWSVDIKADETPYRLIADNSTGVADIHDGIFVNKRINHVHELQHALRLCNIEKEIIL